MSQHQPDQHRLPRWVVPGVVVIVALLMIGAAVGTRSLVAGRRGAAELTGSRITADPAPVAPTTAPTPSRAEAAPARTTRLAALGVVRGTARLGAPGATAAGTRVGWTLTGPARARFVDSRAPFAWPLDTTRLPNGSYALKIVVLRPGRPKLTMWRDLTVRNRRPVATASAPTAGRTTAPSTTAPEPTTAKPTDGGPTGGGLNAETAEVLTLTNVERAKAGCGPLASNSKLATAAQGHSADMAENDYFAHDSQNGESPFDRMKDAGYAFSAAAENIAYGQPDARAVMAAWMNSPGHRTNILNCTYTEIGIGYALRGNTPYWTQDFGKPLG